MDLPHDSPNENIIIKFKLSDIKPKPKSFIDSDSEQDNYPEEDHSNYSV